LSRPRHSRQNPTSSHRLAPPRLGRASETEVLAGRFDGVTVSDLRKAQAVIATGRWRESSQAKDWAGHAVADVLRLDATNKAHRAKIAAPLKHGSPTARSLSSRARTPSARSGTSWKSEPQPMVERRPARIRLSPYELHEPTASKFRLARRRSRY
jgi:hypothetical protein